MAKTAAVTTRDPIDLGLGCDITAESLLAISQLQNWVETNRRDCHLCLCVGSGDDRASIPPWDDYANVPAGIGAGESDGVQTLGAWLPKNFINEIDVVHTDVWFEPGTSLTKIIVGAECSITASSGDSVAVKFAFTGSLGGANKTCTCTYSDNQTEVNDVIDLSSAVNTGEWVSLVITAQKTGTASTADVRTLRVQESSLITLSDPADT